MNSTTEWLIAGGTIVSAVAVALGLFFAAKSLRSTATANRVQALIRVLELVTKDREAFQSRQWLYEHESSVKNTDAAHLTKVARDHLENVCRAWDRVGWLIKWGPLDDKPILAYWGQSVDRLWEIAKTYIFEKRSDGSSNPHFAGHFEALALLAKEHLRGGRAPTRARTHRSPLPQGRRHGADLLDADVGHQGTHEEHQ